MITKSLSEPKVYPCVLCNPSLWLQRSMQPTYFVQPLHKARIQSIAERT